MRLSRTAALAVAVALVGSTGCTAVRLGQRTMRQASTLPDLQYQQVLDNLARFVDDPAALPWHVNFREGTTQITDSAGAGAAVDLGPPSNTLPQLFGSRTVVVQWGMTPVIEHTALRLLPWPIDARHRPVRDARPRVLERAGRRAEEPVPLQRRSAR